MGIGYIGQALIINRRRSVFAPRLFGNAAPDAGNAELLLIAATDEQKEKYLRPLAAGGVRSCFAMTEPRLPVLIRLDCNYRGARWRRWVITGTSGFISGAIGSAFAIVMAVPISPPRRTHAPA